MSEIEFEKIKLDNGETMAYRHVGCGENKVILIHGFQSSSQFFEDLLEGLDENIEVFAPDLIGYGESSYENKHKEMKEWAEDLKYFADSLDIDNFSLVGWSLGGLVAMDFAGIFPEKIKQLILIASVGVKGFVMPKDKDINDDDILMLVGKDRSANARIAIDYLQVTSGIGMRPVASIGLNIAGEKFEAAASGNGPVDAAINAVKQIIHRKMTVQEFLIQAITKGSDDVGKVHITVSYEGVHYYGFSANTDIVAASVEAFIDAINKFIV